MIGAIFVYKLTTPFIVATTFKVFQAFLIMSLSGLGFAN
jgi:hypothetical protein